MPSLILGVGFIGSLLAGQLITVGEEVVGFDNLFSTDRRALDALGRHGAFRLVEGDLASPDDVRRAFDAAEVDVVYLLAGQSSPDDSAVPAEYTELTNLRGPRLVLEEMARRGVDTIVFASSLRVLGQPLPDRFDEASPYGVQRDLSHLTRIYAEKLIELHAARRPMRAVAARLAIVYGLSPVMKRSPAFMTVPNRFCWQARRGEPLRVAPGQGQISLLHVEDAVAALIRCADAPWPGYQPVNVLGDWTPLAELARLVVEEGGRRGLAVPADIPAEPAPPPPVGASRLEELGFRPRRDLRSGVRELLDYFLAGEG